MVLHMNSCDLKGKDSTWPNWSSSTTARTEKNIWKYIFACI